MRLPRMPHRWDLTPAEAAAVQRRMAQRVRQTPLEGEPRFVAGGDVSFFDEGRRLVAGWVVWDSLAESVVATASDVGDAAFPYVPGLLSFREAPVLLSALTRLELSPDVLMLDGHGLAHPRRFGLACHIGVLIDRPTIGCAKSRLCGHYKDPGSRAGASRQLLDDDEVIGRVVRTRDGVRPVYVSVGHQLSLEDAVRITRSCCTRYRLPEPTRQAHQLVTRLRASL